MSLIISQGNYSIFFTHPISLIYSYFIFLFYFTNLRTLFKQKKGSVELSRPIDRRDGLAIRVQVHYL